MVRAALNGWSGGDSWASHGVFRFAVPWLVPLAVLMAGGLVWRSAQSIVTPYVPSRERRKEDVNRAIAAGKGATAASDIYSLGCTLWFLLSGRQPYSGANAREVMKQHFTKHLASLAEWTARQPHVGAVLRGGRRAILKERCLQRDPQRGAIGSERDCLSWRNGVRLRARASCAGWKLKSR